MTDLITADTFLARIAKTPDDIDAYLVYADWLQQQGDPRGEFVLLCHAAESPDKPVIAAAREQYLSNWGGILLGDLHEPLAQGQIDIRWRLGFVDRLKITPGALAQEILNRLPGNPGCRFLRHLDISHTDISTLPDDFSNLTQITELDLRACPIDRLNYLPRLDRLTRVRVSGCEPPVPLPTDNAHPFELFANEPHLANRPSWVRAACYQAAAESTGDHDQPDALQNLELENAWFWVNGRHSHYEDQTDIHYLRNMRDWSPRICVALANEQGHIRLGHRHWLMISLLREYWDENEITPAIRRLLPLYGQQLGLPQLGQGRKDVGILFDLFPYGPGIQAARAAGLPRPHV